MKELGLLILLITSYCAGIAQYNNKVWVIGYNPLEIKFKIDSSYNDTLADTEMHAICGLSNINESENMLFMSNGFHVYDYGGILMENGKYIVPPKYVDNSPDYSLLAQQTIILPKKDYQYYLFSWGISDMNYDKAQINGGWYIYDVLTYSLVDLSYNNGKGKVISKLNYLLNDPNDSLSISQMSAVRHANGRDWWLVKPHFSHHKFFTFLVTPSGIVPQQVQEFEDTKMLNGVLGQSNFSLDGSLYAITCEYNPDHTTQINYFDRCSGKMTPYKTIKWTYDSSAQTYLKVGGVCFSPNNQYVYLINNLSIQQYDLTNDERIELNVDSSINPMGNTVAYNGYDGKIYIANFQTQINKLSIITNPNVKGIGANYCQLCYVTKNSRAASPPNMPNYELGKLVDSPCDTIGKVYSEDVVMYPNPASDNITVFVPSEVKTNIGIYLYNTMGQAVLHEQQVSDDRQKIYLNLKHLAKGVYNLKIEAEGKLYIRKLIKN